MDEFFECVITGNLDKLKNSNYLDYYLNCRYTNKVTEFKDKTPLEIAKEKNFSEILKLFEDDSYISSWPSISDNNCYIVDKLSDHLKTTPSTTSKKNRT